MYIIYVYTHVHTFICTYIYIYTGAGAQGETQRGRAGARGARSAGQFIAFTSTKVQILTKEGVLYRGALKAQADFNLRALLVQMYKY